MGFGGYFCCFDWYGDNYVCIKKLWIRVLFVINNEENVMKIIFILSMNLLRVVEFIFNNMCDYYVQFVFDWDVEKVFGVIVEFINYDI